MYRLAKPLQSCLKLTLSSKPLVKSQFKIFWSVFAFHKNQKNFLFLDRRSTGRNMAGAVDKIESLEFQSLLTPELLTLASAFDKRGYDLRIVGGAVRDILLGIKPKDVDMSTNATPEQMIELFNDNQIRYIETGLQHGTLTAHLSQQDFEITTLRIDAETDGRHAKVKFTDDWKLDAERRDLTFNAMSLTLDGTLHDYFGGRNDLENRRVRFVGDPRCRIQEDYLRILRYFRFYGRIAENPDSHDQATLDVISQCVEGLDKIAVERIWVEVSKILIGNHAPSLLQHIYNLKVAEHIGLPRYSGEGFKEFERAWNEHQKFKLQPSTLLFSLVSDATQADLLGKRWKLSNAERAVGKFIVIHRIPKAHQRPLKPYQDMIVSSAAPKFFETLREHVTELLHCQGRHAMAEQMAVWVPPEFPITGSDLKEAGVKPGPEFGKILNQLKQTWKESYYTSTKEDLLEKLEHFLKS